MKTAIEETETGTWLVNGVEVYEKGHGEYHSKGLVTPEATKDFLEYVKKNKSKLIVSDLESLKTALKSIEEKLEMLKKQKEIIDNRKDTFSDEALKLRNYYHKMIHKYEHKKQTIINKLPVSYKSVS